MARYVVSQVDGSTFVVIDQQQQREICVCSDYDDKVDAKERAEKLASLMNKDATAGWGVN